MIDSMILKRAAEFLPPKALPLTVIVTDCDIIVKCNIVRHQIIGFVILGMGKNEHKFFAYLLHFKAFSCIILANTCLRRICA